MERRKRVRPTLRRDLQIVPQQQDGRRCYVVKDPVTLRYYRFQAPEHFILQHLDGSHTLADVQQEFEQQFRPRRLPLEEVEAFTSEIIQSGLAHAAGEATTADLLRRRRRRQRRERWAFWSNLLSLQLPVCDPDRMLGGMVRLFKSLLSPACFFLGVAFILTALALVTANFDVFCARLPGQREFFTLHHMVYLWLALGLAKIGHELGHGLACKVFGGEVHELGVMFLCFSPCLYCDVSDAWTLPGKWRRILVSCAGMYVELLIAAAATFVWWNAPARPFLQQMSLSLMIVCSLGTIVFNANPLLRYDGYYALADWLELPNMYAHSRRSLLAAVAAGLGFGSRSRWRGWLAAYGLASTLYRWGVTLAVLWMLYHLLKPYRLEALGLLAGVGSVGLMAFGPLVQLVRFVRSHRRNWEMVNHRRMLLSFGLLGVLQVSLFLVPLPMGQIQQCGLLQIPPDAVESVYLQVPGILEHLHVRNGQRVEAGQLLAEFHSGDLDTLRAAAVAERDVLAVESAIWRERLSSAVEPVERTTCAAQLAKLTAEQPRLGREAQLYDEMRQRLQVRSPRSGIVFGLPPVDEIGKSWEKDGGRPFCRIGAADQLWVVLPLETADFRRLQEDFDASRQTGAELSASICVAGRGDRTWPGRIAQLPETDATEIPLPLTQRAGGPVAARPVDNVLRPVSQHYLVAVQFLGPDSAVVPGGLATVAIRGRWRTAADCLWRLLATSFDLGFLS